MRTNRERLHETLYDLVIDDRMNLAGDRDTNEIIAEYVDRIMSDINSGIIAPERPGS